MSLNELDASVPGLYRKPCGEPHALGDRNTVRHDAISSDLFNGMPERVTIVQALAHTFFLLIGTNDA